MSTIPTFTLPADCTHTCLIDALQHDGLLDGDWKFLFIQAKAPVPFVHASALAFLCIWGMHCRTQGRQVVFQGDHSLLSYLARMNLFRHTGFSTYDEHFTRHNEKGRFIPLYLVQDDRDTGKATNAICDLALRTFENGRALLPALEWTVFEMIDNIHNHSETRLPGVLCAQFYPKLNRIDLCIVDWGRGIRASLAEAYALDSHAAAIEKALQRGVTRSQAVGQGNGLAGSLEISRCNQGSFHLWSGDCNFHLSRQGRMTYEKIAQVPGTGVFFHLDPTKPVDLSQTFIGHRDWTYLEAEGERLQSEGLRVSQECAHTGSRLAASTLRRKIEALLPEMPDGLEIDFKDVSLAASSFLDELFSPLLADLGEVEFRRRIRMVNASPLLTDMANNVLGQRFQHGSYSDMR